MWPAAAHGTVSEHLLISAFQKLYPEDKMKKSLFIILTFALLALTAAAGASSITVGLSQEPVSLDPAAGLYIPEQFVIQQIFETIQMHNPQVRFGYSDDLQKYFNSLPRQQQNVNENAS